MKISSIFEIVSDFVSFTGNVHIANQTLSELIFDGEYLESDECMHFAIGSKSDDNSMENILSSVYTIEEKTSYLVRCIGSMYGKPIAPITGAKQYTVKELYDSLKFINGIAFRGKNMMMADICLITRGILDLPMSTLASCVEARFGSGEIYL